MMLLSMAPLQLFGTTCVRGSLPCVDASLHTAGLMTPLRTSGMWLRLLIGWPLPNALCPLGLATLTSSLLMHASLTSTLVSMMAACLLPPSLWGR